MALGYRELREFEREYAEIIGLQAKEEIFRRMAATVPALTGLPISSVGGLSETDDHMILRHTVNASAFEGMVVPVGAGLGGQVLFTLGTGIRRLGDLLAGDPAAVAQVRTLGRQANEASVTLRRSLRELSASSEQLALSVTLRQDCRAFEERTGVSARLILLTDLPSLPEPMIVALTKAAREALLNVEKHAAATSVVVSVFASPRRVTLVVSDDGRGLRSDRVAGLGLAAITDRLSRLGGDVMVGPGDDGGVTVQAWVPIPNLVAGQKRR